MDDKNENIPDEVEPFGRNWREIPFDATTNFSLLGWLLDKLSKRKRFKEKIDFTIEE